MTDDDIIKVRDDVIEAAKHHPNYGTTDGPDDVSIAIAFARAIEQRTIERCAEVCDAYADGCIDASEFAGAAAVKGSAIARELAAAIRALGAK